MLKRKEGEVGHRKFNKTTGPSDKWFKAFQKRHSELSWSVPQSIDKHRADAADERKIDSFFNLLGKTNTPPTIKYQINSRSVIVYNEICVYITFPYVVNFFNESHVWFMK